MEFRRAREDGFRVRAGVSVEGRRFLLLDDTFTTGARIQSAYHALIAAGADVPAVIVVARKISSDERYGGNKVLARQKRISFDFEANPWWVS
jgi:orotate phosphoribosyltransferase